MISKNPWLIIFAMGSFLLGCTSKQSNQTSANAVPLKIVNYETSLPGTYYFGVADWSQSKSGPIVSHFIALRSDGTLAFDRTSTHYFRVMGSVLFRPLHQGGSIYFTGFAQPNGFPGEVRFLDDQYQDAYYRVVPNEAMGLDAHDFVEDEKGNLFFLFWRIDNKNFSVNSEIQEWDSSGHIMFSWDAADRIGKMKKTPTSDYSPRAINSINITTDHSLVLSFRDANEVMKISYPSGKILWRLSAEEGWHFQNDPQNGFNYQHCVLELSNGNIILFDNGKSGENRFLRAAEYQLDLKTKTASLVWSYNYPIKTPEIRNGGSVQRLSNGNTLIGWGTPSINGHRNNVELPLATEVNKEGKVIREITTRGAMSSYRIFFAETK